MIIKYSTKKLEKIINDPRLLRKYYGNDYQRIRDRHSELIAANNLAEIPPTPPPRRHKLDGNYSDCWGIDYSKNNRFVIKPIGQYEIDDLQTITEIEIVDLIDYH